MKHLMQRLTPARAPQIRDGWRTCSARHPSTQESLGYSSIASWRGPKILFASVPGLDNIDGNDLIIQPLMYLVYLQYKGTYWHEFDDQSVEEFILQETEDLGQWDVDFIVSDFALTLREA